MLNSRLNVLTLFFVFNFLTVNSFAINPWKEEHVQSKNPTALYFDQASLEQLALESETLSPEATAIKIDEYFSSAPLAINEAGQFYIVEGAYQRNAFLSPRTQNQKHFVFVIPVKLNQSFAQGYMIYMNKIMEQLINALEAGIDLTFDPDDAKTKYQHFYLCLQNVAIVGDQSSLQCLEQALQAVGYKKPQDVSYLANLYIKMYRTSRLAFGTIVTPDEKKVWHKERIAPPIYVDDPLIRESCQMLTDKMNVLDQERFSIMTASMPGVGIFDRIDWHLGGGKSRSQRAQKLFYAVPDVQLVSGAYFDVSVKGGYVSTGHAHLRKLCDKNVR